MESPNTCLLKSYRALGQQIEDIVSQNTELKFTVDRQRDEIKALKINFRAEVKELRDHNAELELIILELKEIMSLQNKESATQLQIENDKPDVNTRVTDPNRHITKCASPNRPLSHDIRVKESPCVSQALLELPLSLDHRSKKQKIKQDSLTDSQYNLLPTQYSSQESVESPTRSTKSNINSLNFSDLDQYDEVEDSQQESPIKFGPARSPMHSKRRALNDVTNSIIKDPTKHMDKLNDISKPVLRPLPQDSGVPRIPEGLTKLQRRAFLKEYYSRMFFKSPSFKINLRTNPITEMQWTLSDFKLNPFYVKPKFDYKETKKEREKHKMFHKLAGPFVKTDALQWNKYTDNDPKFDDVSESQVFDIIPSPPGLMVSDFPDSQETKRRSDIVNRRQDDRIKRRLSLCFMRSKNKNGEFIFQADIFNEYVEKNRFIS